MDKLKLRILPIVSLISLIAGLVIIIKSTALGSDAATAFLGGVTSSPYFSIIVQGYTNSYNMIGAVLFFIGGLGCLISIIFFEMQKQ